MSLPNNHPHKDSVDGLIKLATFLADNPGFVVDGVLWMNVFARSKEQFVAQMRFLGSAAKLEGNAYLTIQKKFSRNVVIELNCQREKVCERVQVGERVIPAEPERTVPEITIPAKPETREPIFEWQCPDSLLALDKESVLDETPETTEPETAEIKSVPAEI